MMSKKPSVIAAPRIGPDRQHREVVRVFELLVDIEREQADEGLLVPDHDRHRRRGDIRAIARDDEVDLVDIEQLCVDAGHQRRVGLVVVIDQLDRPAEQPALGVDVLGPDLRGQEPALAVDRERAGQRHRKPDRDRLAARRLLLGEGRGRKQQPRRERAGHAAEPAPLSSCHHEYPRIRFRSSAGRGGRRSISARARRRHCGIETSDGANHRAACPDRGAIDRLPGDRLLGVAAGLSEVHTFAAKPCRLPEQHDEHTVSREVVASGNRSKQSAVAGGERTSSLRIGRWIVLVADWFARYAATAPGRSRYCNARGETARDSDRLAAVRVAFSRARACREAGSGASPAGILERCRIPSRIAEQPRPARAPAV